MVSDWSSLRRDEVPRSYLEVSQVDRRLLSQVELGGKTLLNLGCGIYHTSDELFYERGASVISLDVSRVLIRTLKNHARLPRVEGSQYWDALVGDGRQLPFEEASLDVVTSFSAIEHIPDAGDRQRVFEEIHRVLKPGGFAALTFPNFLFLPATLLAPIWRRRTGEYEYRFSPGELRRVLLEVGFRQLRFDAQNPESIDETALDTYLPRFVKRLPSLIFEMPQAMFRWANRVEALARFRMRMGFLMQKPGAAG